MKFEHDISYLQTPTLIDYLKCAISYRHIIIKNIFFITMLTLGICFIMPKTYTATSVLLPPQYSGSSSMQNESKMPLFSITGLFDNVMDESMKLISILQSRTVMEKVIDKFNLISFYDSENIEEAIEDLVDATDFEIQEEGTIFVSMSVPTGWFHIEEEEEYAKNLSANISNYFVLELDELNKKLNIERARYHREFIEKRYFQNIVDLKNAEDMLNRFQHQHNLISIEEQTSNMIESASIIKKQILLDELQLQILEKTLNEEDGKIEQIKRKIAEFKLKLEELEKGSPIYSEEEILFPPLSKMPDLSLEYLRLQRELNVQTELFKYFTLQYEEAKVEEAKDVPTVQILDIAKVPERKSHPRRILLILSTLTICTILNALSVISYVNYQNNH